MGSWTIMPQDLFDAGTGNHFLIDIRSSANYDLGYIDGVHHVALADVVSYEAANNTANDPVVVICDTGQVAGHAVMALRLSGVSTAKVLKWGMCGWHSDFGQWTANIDNLRLDYPAGWTTGDDPPTLPSLADPDPGTGLSDGAAILAYQIDNAILDGFNGVNAADVLDDYGDYHTINYWKETDWDTYGHITDAYLIDPDDLAIDLLAALDPTGVNVVYCWSGQTSSMVTAWLSLFGYDARSLKYGVNAITYDDLTGHNWTASMAADLPYVTGTSMP
jgi:rhodanese-related sulfurtransferase